MDADKLHSGSPRLEFLLRFDFLTANLELDFCPATDKLKPKDDSAHLKMKLNVEAYYSYC